MKIRRLAAVFSTLALGIASAFVPTVVRADAAIPLEFSVSGTANNWDRYHANGDNTYHVGPDWNDYDTWHYTIATNHLLALGSEAVTVKLANGNHGYKLSFRENSAAPSSEADMLSFSSTAGDRNITLRFSTGAGGLEVQYYDASATLQPMCTIKELKAESDAPHTIAFPRVGSDYRIFVDGKTAPLTSTAQTALNTAFASHKAYLCICQTGWDNAVYDNISIIPDDTNVLLSTDKDVYIDTELPTSGLMVTAVGDATSRISLFVRSETPPAGQEPVVTSTIGENSGVPIDLQAIAANGIPAGEYTLYLLDKDNAVLAKKDISVVKETSLHPDLPTSVSYSRESGASVGSAAGKLTITSGDNLPDSYVVYWADKNGALAGYTPLASLPVTKAVTEYSVPDTLIPNEADRLLVRAVKNGETTQNSVSAMLPKDSNDYDLGTLLYEFQVVSDTHVRPVGDGFQGGSNHFASALEDIKTISPDSAGLMINGDVVDDGTVAQYQTWQKILTDAGWTLDKVHCGIGNHEYYIRRSDEDISDEGLIKRFLEYTNANPDVNTIYHDFWLEGAHFIFLGSEALGDHMSATLSDTQLSWLEEKLAEKRDKGRPIYVFLHQGLDNTVSGTFDGVSDIKQNDKLAAILKKYPEVILFSGHTHADMNGENNMKARDEDLPSIFNTGAIVNLWENGKQMAGAQGYYVYVFEDKVILRGRDFVNNLWVAAAQYQVGYTADSSVTPKPTEPVTPNPTTSADSLSTNPTNGMTPSASNTPSPTTGDTGLSYLLVACTMAVVASALLFFTMKKQKAR